jgi:hypothetical protein
MRTVLADLIMQIINVRGEQCFRMSQMFAVRIRIRVASVQLKFRWLCCPFMHWWCLFWTFWCTKSILYAVKAKKKKKTCQGKSDCASEKLDLRFYFFSWLYYKGLNEQAMVYHSLGNINYIAIFPGYYPPSVTKSFFVFPNSIILTSLLLTLLIARLR